MAGAAPGGHAQTRGKTHPEDVNDIMYHKTNLERAARTHVDQITDISNPGNLESAVAWGLSCSVACLGHTTWEANRLVILMWQIQNSEVKRRTQQGIKSRS